MQITVNITEIHFPTLKVLVQHLPKDNPAYSFFLKLDSLVEEKIRAYAEDYINTRIKSYHLPTFTLQTEDSVADYLLSTEDFPLSFINFIRQGIVIARKEAEGSRKINLYLSKDELLAIQKTDNPILKDYPLFSEESVYFLINSKFITNLHSFHHYI